jgi:membrane-associated protease RseP (regulator of RpoE activity)
MCRFGYLLAALSLTAGVAVSQEAPRPAPKAQRLDSVVELAPRERVRIMTMRRARLGVSVNLRAEASDSIGALIQSVTPNGPAARAGIQTGDLITRFNGKPLVGESFVVGKEQSAPGLRLIELAALLEPGDSVVVEYRRGTARRNATIVAGDEPAYVWRTPDGGSGFAYGTDPEAVAEAFRRSQEAMEPMLHRVPAPEIEFREMPGYSPGAPRALFFRGGPLAELELAPMNADLGRYFGTTEGVLVIRAPSDSKLRLKGGDVVLSVDGREVATPAHLIRVLRSYEPGESFRLELLRMKKRETVQGTIAE